MLTMGFLAPIVLVGLILATFIGYIFIATPARYWIKYTLIPVALLVAGFSWLLFIGKLGYAIPVEMPDQVLLINYKVVVKEYKKVGIELWVQEDKDTRLYVVPYNKATEKMLKEAQKAAKKGGVPRLNRKEGGDRDPNESPFSTDILTPSEAIPKDKDPNEVEEAPEPKPAPKQRGDSLRSA